MIHVINKVVTVICLVIIDQRLFHYQTIALSAIIPLSETIALSVIVALSAIVTLSATITEMLDR